jgi:hypothetical protein
MCSGTDLALMEQDCRLAVLAAKMIPNIRLNDQKTPYAFQEKLLNTKRYELLLINLNFNTQSKFYCHEGKSRSSQHFK